nr:hypothetical protein CFP56_57621 [Quercus suber]
MITNRHVLWTSHGDVPILPPRRIAHLLRTPPASPSTLLTFSLSLSNAHYRHHLCSGSATLLRSFTLFPNCLQHILCPYSPTPRHSLGCPDPALRDNTRAQYLTTIRLFTTFRNILETPHFANMQTTIFTLATLAAVVVADRGSGNIINSCDYEVNLNNVPAGGNGQEAYSTVLSANGGTYSQEWTSLAVGGWSMKLNPTSNDVSVMQFEYSYSDANPNNLWFDLSYVNGNPFSGAWLISSSSDDCLVKQTAYNNPTDDANGMQSECTPDVSITVELCPSSDSEEGASSSSTVVEPVATVATVATSAEETAAAAATTTAVAANKDSPLDTSFFDRPAADDATTVTTAAPSATTFATQVVTEADVATEVVFVLFLFLLLASHGACTGAKGKGDVVDCSFFHFVILSVEEDFSKTGTSTRLLFFVLDGDADRADRLGQEMKSSSCLAKVTRDSAMYLACLVMPTTTEESHDSDQCHKAGAKPNRPEQPPSAGLPADVPTVEDSSTGLGKRPSRRCALTSTRCMFAEERRQPGYLGSIPIGRIVSNRLDIGLLSCETATGSDDRPGDFVFTVFLRSTEYHTKHKTLLETRGFAHAHNMYGIWRIRWARQPSESRKRKSLFLVSLKSGINSLYCMDSVSRYDMFRTDGWMERRADENIYRMRMIVHVDDWAWAKDEICKQESRKRMQVFSRLGNSAHDQQQDKSLSQEREGEEARLGLYRRGVGCKLHSGLMRVHQLIALVGDLQCACQCGRRRKMHHVMDSPMAAKISETALAFLVQSPEHWSLGICGEPDVWRFTVSHSDGRLSWRTQAVGQARGIGH